MSDSILTADEFGFHAGVRLDRAETALTALLRQLTLDRDHCLTKEQEDQIERIKSLVSKLDDEYLLRPVKYWMEAE